MAYWRIVADKTGHVFPRKTYINTKTYVEVQSRDHDGPDAEAPPFELDAWSVPFSVFKQHVVPHLMDTAPIEFKYFPDHADRHEYANALLKSFVHSREQLELINRLVKDHTESAHTCEQQPLEAPSPTSSITLATMPKKRAFDRLEQECTSGVACQTDFTCALVAPSNCNQHIRDVYEEWSGFSWHTATDAVIQAPMTRSDAVLLNYVDSV